jgi:hypothetical protein
LIETFTGSAFKVIFILDLAFLATLAFVWLNEIWNIDPATEPVIPRKWHRDIRKRLPNPDMLRQKRPT